MVCGPWDYINRERFSVVKRRSKLVISNDGIEEDLSIESSLWVVE